jgi:hypothetical protein
MGQISTSWQFLLQTIVEWKSTSNAIGKQWMPKGHGIGSSRIACEGVHQQPKVFYEE